MTDNHVRKQSLVRASAFIFCSVFALSGCVTATTTQSNTASAQVLEQEDEYYDIGELKGQKLAVGECGMFLFASRPEPRFVFFAEATSGVAKMVLDGKTVQLQRLEGSGALFDLHYENQSFASPDQSISVKVNVTEARAQTGGFRVSRAAIRITSPAGWDMVVPVGGATSCQS